jgi:hypothetical protein
METTEKIVEAYVRYVKRWATIPNLRCGPLKELDLFAIDPCTDARYHIETSVSISGAYSKLTAKELAPDEHKDRVKQAGARRKLSYFLEHKFSPEPVRAELASLGCDPNKVNRVIVTWDATPEALAAAEAAGVMVWLFPDMLEKIERIAGREKTYFGDDTLRTLTLAAKAAELRARRKGDPGSSPG